MKNNKDLSHFAQRALKAAHQASPQPKLDQCWCNELMAKIGRCAREQRKERRAETWFSPSGLVKAAAATGLVGALGLVYLATAGIGLDNGATVLAASDPTGFLHLLTVTF